MSGVYLANAALDEIEASQAELARHMTSSADGRCLVCHVEGPCRPQLAIVRKLMVYGQLPRRQPGATQPERIGPQRGRGSWFSTNSTAAAS
jgi:hypothetical protein